MNIICGECGGGFVARGASGRTPTYCGSRCRQRAYRARKAVKGFDRLVAVSAGRWVRAEGKRPLTVRGYGASSTDPGTWSTYREVCESTAGDGYGVMLGAWDGQAIGLGCHDLDDCFNEVGVLRQWARDVLATIDPVFIEVSMSGRGLHAFVMVEPGRGSRRGMPNGGGHEVYRQQRFIRVTGSEWKS